MLLSTNLTQKNCTIKEMHALRHESCLEPEVCDGVARDEMSEDDFDKRFKQESHKLFWPQRLVSSNVEGLYTKAMAYFVGLCRQYWDAP